MNKEKESHVKENVCAVTYGTPPIIRADKVEEFLNLKPDKEKMELHKKRLEKYDHIVTDKTNNTK